MNRENDDGDPSLRSEEQSNRFHSCRCFNFEHYDFPMEEHRDLTIAEEDLSSRPWIGSIDNLDPIKSLKELKREKTTTHEQAHRKRRWLVEGVIFIMIVMCMLIPLGVYILLTKGDITLLSSTIAFLILLAQFLNGVKY